MNVLILAHIPHNEIGGHTVTATQLANSFNNSGHQTFIFINPQSPALSNLEQSVSVIDDKWTKNKSDFVVRITKINKALYENKIDLIITVDKISCYQAFTPAAYNNIPLVPIIPGGSKNALKRSPIKTKKIIVFSKENEHVLINKWKFNPSTILIKNSRFSFSEEILKKYPTNEFFRISYISSMRVGKFQAFTHFIDQISKINKSNILIDILGDGHDVEIFKDYAKKSNINNIIFKGYSNINLETMKVYNLIVTQGRGVIEAAGMNIPVAICGENGYKGLLVIEDIHLFEPTNFTGRDVNKRGDMGNDISYLLKNSFDYAKLLAITIRSNFDIENLREEIINITNNYNMIPSNGSVVRSIFQNFKVLFNIKL